MALTINVPNGHAQSLLLFITDSYFVFAVPAAVRAGRVQGGFYYIFFIKTEKKATIKSLCDFMKRDAVAFEAKGQHSYHHSQDEWDLR